MIFHCECGLCNVSVLIFFQMTDFGNLYWTIFFYRRVQTSTEQLFKKCRYQTVVLVLFGVLQQCTPSVSQHYHSKPEGVTILCQYHILFIPDFRLFALSSISFINDFLIHSQFAVFSFSWPFTRASRNLSESLSLMSP